MRAWRKVARAMLDSGYRVTRTADGHSALVSDLEAYFAKSADPVDRDDAERDVKPQNVEPTELSDSEVFKRAGLVTARRAS